MKRIGYEAMKRIGDEVMKRMGGEVMKRWLAMLVLSGLLAACSETGPQQRAVYLLLDSSGTYTEELDKARALIAYLLGTLESGDSMAVALINGGSFTEKNIVAMETFEDRPSLANSQKRAFKEKVDSALSSIKRGAAHTDITGGMLQGQEFLQETGAGERYLLVFSDLEEDLPKNYIRDFPMDMSGARVIALNVTKLRQDNIDPRDYAQRLDQWQERVESGGGSWRVINDLERLSGVLEGR